MMQPLTHFVAFPVTGLTERAHDCNFTFWGRETKRLETGSCNVVSQAGLRAAESSCLKPAEYYDHGYDPYTYMEIFLDVVLC